MPQHGPVIKLRLPIGIDQFGRLNIISAAKGVSNYDAAVDIWQLGLAAAEAGWTPREDTDRQLVTVSAAEGAAAT